MTNKSLVEQLRELRRAAEAAAEALRQHQIATGGEDDDRTER